jgi:hypothetical protein
MFNPRTLVLEKHKYRFKDFRISSITVRVPAIIAQPLEKVKLASSTNHPYLLPA